MFEYDPVKSAANMAKHGIDFDEARMVWADPNAQRVDARSDTEPRFAVIGRVEGKYWAVFATLRGNRVRIISARRARRAEVQFYETQNRQRQNS